MRPLLPQKILFLVYIFMAVVVVAVQGRLSYTQRDKDPFNLLYQYKGQR